MSDLGSINFAAVIDVQTVAGLKQATLALDLAIARPWRLYVDGNHLLQENGSNPKIRQLGEQESMQLTQLTDKILIYEARVIKSETLKQSIGSQRTYELSFDEGSTKQKFQLLKISEANIQDFAWHIFLGR